MFENTVILPSILLTAYCIYFADKKEERKREKEEKTPSKTNIQQNLGSAGIRTRGLSQLRYRPKARIIPLDHRALLSNGQKFFQLHFRTFIS